MSLDFDRAAFVKSEYRYAIVQDNAVLAAYPEAQEIVIETQLDDADAQSVASQLLQDTKTVAQTFEVEIEGLISLDHFTGSVNRYTVSFPQYKTDNRVFKLSGATIDYEANRSVLKVRG